MQGWVIGRYAQSHQQQIYGSSYVFRSDSRVNERRGYGFNLGLQAKHGLFDSELGVSYIATLTDATGLQRNHAPASIPFSGFGASKQTESLQHAVPGVDVHGRLSYGHYGLIGEYVTATRSFARGDLSFNGQGAQPQALHIEGVDHWHLAGKPGSFALGYDQTKQALALLLPKQRFMAVLNYSFWRNTLASLEYKYSAFYDATDRARGAGSQPFGPRTDHANAITAQLAVYF
jgi:hypothetical protein